MSAMVKRGTVVTCELPINYPPALPPPKISGFEYGLCSKAIFVNQLPYNQGSLN